MNYRSIAGTLAVSVGLFVGSHDAGAETLTYKGTLELLRVSGASCTDMPAGKTIPVEMVVNRDGNRIQGYYTGKDVQMGKFGGSNPFDMEVFYPDPAGGTGHHIGLHFAPGKLTGQLNEKPLDTNAKGCNFDAADLVLEQVDDGRNAPQLFKKLADKFSYLEAYNRALDAYGGGDMAKAVPGFEAAIRMLKESDGEKAEGLIDPYLYLSMAYCTLGRFNEGYKLQEKAFAIPEEQEKRKLLRNTILVKLINGQVEQLVHDGKLDVAMALLDNFSRRYPDLSGLQASRAVMLVGMRRSQQACSELEKVLKDDPENEILKESMSWCLTQQANEQMYNDDFEGAAGNYRRAFSLYPRSVSAFKGVLSAYLYARKVDQATAYYTENVETLAKYLPPNHVKVIQMSFLKEAAQFREKEGKLDQAEKLYRQAVEISLNPAFPATDLARVLNKERRFPEVERLLTEQRKLCADDNCKKAIDESLEKERNMDRLVRRLEQAVPGS